jgi:tetratricopeptide (TPR) repeat protein
LVALYPTKENWSLAIAVVRDLNGYQGLDQLDLLRLMQRTGSFSEERDYVEYVQAATKRGMPGEALKIIDAGVAAGMLKPNDQFVMDAKKESTARVGADRASLPAQERDARGPKGTSLTITAAADTFLSYDLPAKAEELYELALTKPGTDVSRIYLRLGIAQADQGKYADALANFAKVTDARAPIAMLWSAYAKAKAAGK